jgi:hypothetical protein
MSAVVVSLLGLLLAADAAPPAGKYFKITVVDDETGRGVPLVELRTVNQLRYYTDSNGIVAFHEPGLMGQPVFFHVRSHGYEFPKDGFGFRGKALDVTEGGSATLKVKRVNIAERLYRVTGGGIYADSVLTGQPAPLRRPVLDGLVLGSDSVLNTVYRGKLRWFWGDTNRPAYPLGNFHTPGATSLLPADGGLDPEVGIDLDYLVDDKGFARPTAQMPGDGPTWLGGLVVLRDAKNEEHLFAAYAKVRNQLDIYERGLVEFDDDKRLFRKVVSFDPKAPLYLQGHPFRHTTGGVDYLYFGTPYPLIRVRADAEDLRHPERYEAFTCLKEGSSLEQAEVERDGDRPRYAWKKNTPVVGPAEQAKLNRKGKLTGEEALLQLRDGETGKPVSAHSGSVYWNEYRRRWVMIAVESFGTSALGEVWFAEADTPLGPWIYARKVVTHDRYSFYNPKQHPMFDKDKGRAIFFEGTYTFTFSGNPEPTPRYDYNQVLYKLDLADPRLTLPVPIYALAEDVALGPFGTVATLKPGGARRMAFLALDRAAKGTVPVFAQSAEGGGLQVGVEPGSKLAPLFHALPADMKGPPATTLPLYEYVHADGKQRAYSVDPNWTRAGFTRAAQPLCLVWRNPLLLTLPVE